MGEMSSGRQELSSGMYMYLFTFMIFFYEGISRSKKVQFPDQERKKRPRLKMNMTSRDFHGTLKTNFHSEFFLPMKQFL